MKLTRRMFIQGAAAVTALMAAPRALLAWPEKAFKAGSSDEVMQALFGSADVTESGSVVLNAPDIAENGRVVPISVSSSLDGVENISVIVVENPSPLAASFDLGPGASAAVSTRIKMGKTSNVIAVVKADGKLYSAQKEVKVTIGGCGG
ncbi:MAG: thiosulfate oxidation carrier protein SoxY [Chromatiales bacterium]|nr:thiosulfate oxidation carrier protein SoxY [Chromatiales bacterium]MDH4031347.1 thiosulfate oxidation carrier protein SoxY [Chromatiales bacterium]